MKNILMITFLMTGFVMPTLAFDCSITCGNGSSCSATGSEATCKCSWLTGNARCKSKGEQLEEGDEIGGVDKRGVDEISFAQQGGDLDQLLNSKMSMFFNMLVEEFGFGDDTVKTIGLFKKLRAEHIAGDYADYDLALEALESHIDRMTPRDRRLMTDFALYTIEIQDAEIQTGIKIK